jgi:tape measure domain-containing protein
MTALSDRIGTTMSQGFTAHGHRAGQNFGDAFSSQLARSLPVVSGFSTAMRGYETEAAKIGAAAGRALGVAFNTAATGLIAASGYTLFKGFERFETIDKARVQLEHLGFTGQQVQQIYTSLNQVVTGTPIALSDAFGAVSIAVAGGIRDVPLLTRYVQDMADATGISTGNFQEMSSIFSEILASGHLQGQEVLRLTRNSVNIVAWLADSMHKSTADIKKDIELGKISFEDFAKAVEAHAGGMSHALGETVAGSVENLKTAVARGGANFLSAIFGKPQEDANTLKGAVEGLTHRVDDFGQWVTAHHKDIEDFFKKGADAVHGLITGLDKVSALFGGWPSMIGQAVVAFATWKTIAGVTALITNLRTINTALEVTIPASAAKAGAAIDTTLGASMAKFAPLLRLLPLMAVGAMEDVWTTSDQENVDTINKIRQQHGKPPLQPGQDIPGMPGHKVPVPGGAPAGAPVGPPVPGGARGNVGSGFGAAGPAGQFPGSALATGTLPPAPELPFPAEYGQGLAPGETAEHWRARMAIIEAQHNVAEKRARVDQLEKAGVATQDQLVKAKNEVVQAELQQTEAEQRLTQQKASQVAVPYGPGFGAPPRRGQTSEQYSAEQSFLEAQHKSAQAQAELRQVQASATATTTQRTDAENNLLKAQQEQYQSQLRLHDAYTKANGKLDEFGAKIDADFGISKGLSGIAENLTKFLANLAFAPVFGALSAMTAASGGVPQGAAGLIGMAALAGGYGSRGAVGGLGGLAGGLPAALGGGGTGGYPGDAALLARVPSGKYDASGDLSKGLGDCSSAVEDLVNMLDGRSTAGRSMATGNAAEWLTSRGFMPGMGGPGDFRVGFNSEHMQATLPGGTPFNWGSDAAAANRGIGGTGAYDPAFTSHFYRPTGGGGSAPPDSALFGGAPGFWGNTPGIGNNSAGGLSDYIIGRGQQLGLTPTEIGMALAVMQHEGKGPTGNYSMGFGPEAKASGFNFDNNPNGAVDQYLKQYVSRLSPGMNRNDPKSIADYIWHTVHNASDPNYGPGLLSSYHGPAGGAGMSPEDSIRAGIVPQHPGIPTPQAPSYDNGGAVPIIAHEGEHVLTKGDVAAMGGQGGVYAFRQALHYDGGGEIISPQDLGGLLGGSSSPSTHNAAPPGASTAPFGPPPSPVTGAPENLRAPGQLGPFPTPAGLQAPAPTQGQPGQQEATKIGGAEPPKGYGTGASAGGGALGAAEGAAAMAANAFAPGSGVAVQIASQELNRAIQQAGKYVGIGIGGLEETFLPFGGSKLAQSNWITKLAGGLAGASPALPNLAGQAASGPLTPQQAFGGPPSPFGGQQSQTSIEHGVHIDNITIHGDQPARKTATEIQDQLQTVTNLGGLTGQR